LIHRPTMQRKLEPFDVVGKSSGLMVTPVGISDLPHGACYERFGFKRNSAQDRFLKSGGAGFVVIVHGVHDDPVTAFVTPDSSMVSCAFGEITPQRSTTGARVWYVGVNKENQMNDSHHGVNWGHYGLTPHVLSNHSVRWKLGGKNVTAAMHQKVQIAHGSANPFAVLALLEFCKLVKHHAKRSAMTIEQHPGLPCAQLFHTSYSHATHPAICLIYQSLGFVKTAMGTYAWYSDLCPPFEAHHDRFVAYMLEGRDASS
jgi:hypothetical protein